MVCICVLCSNGTVPINLPTQFERYAIVWLSYTGLARRDWSFIIYFRWLVLFTEHSRNIKNKESVTFLASAKSIASDKVLWRFTAGGKSGKLGRAKTIKLHRNRLQWLESSVYVHFGFFRASKSERAGAFGWKLSHVTVTHDTTGHNGVTR